jgi:hypothetical protein
MPLVPHIRSVWRSLRYKERLDDELDEALRAYVDELTDRHMRRGLDPASARRAAVIHVGGLEYVKDEVRSARAGHAAVTIAATAMVACYVPARRVIRLSPLEALG